MDRSKRHGPNRLSNYLQTHETILQQLKDAGAVQEECCLEEDDSHSGSFALDGELLLREGVLKVTVTKGLEFLDDDPRDPLVQTCWYSYNVSIVGWGNVFRYCSPHGEDDGIPHHDQHHRHQFDPFGPTPDNETRIDRIEDGDWPLLSEVIEEADEWFLENRERVLALKR